MSLVKKTAERQLSSIQPARSADPKKSSSETRPSSAAAKDAEAQRRRARTLAKQQ